MSFVLSPATASATSTPGSPAAQALPPLPSGEAKLTATRMLRVGKAATYVCEKLGYLSAATPPKSGQASIIGGSRRPSSDVNAGNGASTAAGSPPAAGAAAGPGKLTKQSSGLNLSMTSLAAESGRDSSSDQVSLPQPDDLELLCNGAVLDPSVTLAQVARFVSTKQRPIQWFMRASFDLTDLPSPPFDPSWTHSQYWKSSGDPKIEYRLRSRADTDAGESVASS